MTTQTIDLPVALPDAEECERCAARLESEIGRLKGVASVARSGGGSAVRVAYDPDALTPSHIEHEARRIGARIAEEIAHEALGLEGLDCPDCAASVEKAVRRLPGVVWARANFASGQLLVEYERDRASLQDICRAAADHGVRACPLAPARAPDAGGAAEASRPWWHTHRRVLLTSASAVLALAALGLSSARLPALTVALYAASIALSGWSTARAAWRSAKLGSLDMNVLMTLAVIGAAAVGEWFEGASVFVLYNVGSLLQNYTVERTRRSMRALMSLAPPTARVLRGGREVETPLDQVPVGYTIRVRPGERIPLDGLVTGGASSVNEASVTGESVPVEKAPGASVFAGTLNLQGSLDFEATHLFRDTTLSRIIESVEEAQAQRAPAQQFVDAFARIYTPIVVALAAVVAVAPPLVAHVWSAGHSGAPLHALWGVWLMRGLALLLVACPCALVISTPVAIVAATGSASRRGALIKGGAYLEELGRLRAVLYDKTGTLTSGRFRITEVLPVAAGLSEADVLRIAAALESRSEHPLAEAFQRWAHEQVPGGLPHVAGFQAMPGGGVRGEIEGHTYLLGNGRLLREQGIVLDGAGPRLAETEARGATAVVLADLVRPLAIIGLADEPREGAAAVISELDREGIGVQAMLTGDAARVADAVADAVGLTEVRAGLLPGGKLQAVRDYQLRLGHVAMVGDGVNDAPALAAANVGIVMGAAGSDTAMETADVALMADDLSRLPWLVRLGRATRAIVAQNIAFSLATKAVLIVAAVTVGLPLWLAVVGDVGVSILVTLNALRLVGPR